MITANIDDLRFLFSALIQMLPMVLTVTLVLIFSLGRFKVFIKETKYQTTCLRHSIILVFVFYLAMLLDISVLFGLTETIEKNNEIFLTSALLLSIISVIYLTLFVVWVIKTILKHKYY